MNYQSIRRLHSIDNHPSSSQNTSELCTSHVTKCYWSRGVPSATASSLQPSCCSDTFFAPKYAINIPISTGALRSFEKSLHFQNSKFWKFLSPFFGGLWGSCPYFQNSYVLPQALPTFYLQRHPYATLKKYPRKSRKPKTFYNYRVTSYQSLSVCWTNFISYRSEEIHIVGLYAWCPWLWQSEWHCRD